MSVSLQKLVKLTSFWGKADRRYDSSNKILVLQLSRVPRAHWVSYQFSILLVSREQPRSLSTWRSITWIKETQRKPRVLRCSCRLTQQNISTGRLPICCRKRDLSSRFGHSHHVCGELDSSYVGRLQRHPAVTEVTRKKIPNKKSWNSNTVSGNLCWNGGWKLGHHPPGIPEGYFISSPNFCIWWHYPRLCPSFLVGPSCVMVRKGTVFILLFVPGHLNALTQASGLWVLFPNSYWTQIDEQQRVSANLHFITRTPAV